MSTWIIRCANRRCRHVCSDTDWVLKPKQNPSPAEIKLRVGQYHCPKCDGKTYVRATAAEIEKAKVPSPRVEAAVAAE